MEISGRFKKLIFSLMKTLTGTDLLAIGFTQKPSLGIALSLIKAHLIRQEPEAALAELKSVLTDPAAFTEHTIYASLADALVKEAEKETADNQIIRLRETGLPYTI